MKTRAEFQRKHVQWKQREREVEQALHELYNTLRTRVWLVYPATAYNRLMIEALRRRVKRWYVLVSGTDVEENAYVCRLDYRSKHNHNR